MNGGNMNGANHRFHRVCVVALLLFAAAPAAIAASPHGICGGVYGVYGIPVIQEDVGAGPLYGLKARAILAGPLAAELSYTRFQEGDVTFSVLERDQTIPGGTQTVIGLNAVLGGPSEAGFGISVTGGVGSYTLTKEHRADLTRTGFNGGLGMELRSSGPIGIDISARLHVIPLKDGGSRKFAALQAGINYYFVR
jgi:hypothetical protein